MPEEEGIDARRSLFWKVLKSSGGACSRIGEAAAAFRRTETRPWKHKSRVLPIPLLSWIGLAAVLASALACSDSRAVGGSHITSDSGAAGWILPDSAVYTIAESNNVPSIMPGLDRPVGAVVLTDGSAVVFSRYALYFVLPEGTVQATAGRRGLGPGEFDRIHLVLSYRDSIVAYDVNQRKVVVYSSGGEFGRERHLGAAVSGEVVAMLRDGEVVVWNRASAEPVDQQVVLFDSGARSPPYGAWIAARRLDITAVFDGRPFRVRHMIGCTAVNLSVGLSRTVFVAEQASGSVFSIVPGGVQREIFRLPERRVDLAFLRRIAGMFGGVPGSERSNLALAEAFGRIGDLFPFAWDRMLPDPTGSVWLRRVECAGERGARLWDIVDTAGKTHHQLTTNLDLLAINGDRVLALLPDSTTLKMFRLRRYE